MFACTALCSQSEGNEDKEVILLLEIARHGARSAIAVGNQLLNTTWDIGMGELTNSGERQHFLQGTRLRRKYIEDLKFLPETFDPRYFYVRSTDYNRTIMSAHSQLLGLYPLGTGPVFESEAQRTAALPPFEVTSEASWFISSDDVLYEKFSPFPVHVFKGSNDFLLKGYDPKLCPIVAELKAKSLALGHEQTKDELSPLYDEMSVKFGIQRETITLDAASAYIDTYEMAKMQVKEIENDLSEESQKLIPKFLHSLFYKGIYGDPLTAKLSSTTFLNYVIDNFSAKIEAHKNSTNASEFHKNIKFIYFSAHDTTVGAFLAAIEQQDSQESWPPLATMNLIELYKKGDKFYMNWNIDGKFLNINNNCNSEGD